MLSHSGMVLVERDPLRMNHLLTDSKKYFPYIFHYIYLLLK